MNHTPLLAFTLSLAALIGAGTAFANEVDIRGLRSVPRGAGIMELFNRADTANEGAVTYEQLRRVAPNFSRERFRMIDRDGDGKISREEARRAQEAWRARRPGPGGPRAGGLAPERRPGPGSFEERLRAADIDGDGKVTREEFRQAFPNAAPGLFDRLDTDGDGVLTPEDRAGAARRWGSEGDGPRRRPERPGAGDEAAMRERFLALLVEAGAGEDGKASLEDVRAVRPGFPEETFNRLDRNNDGYLSIEDLDTPRARPGADRRVRRPDAPEVRRPARPEAERSDRRGEVREGVRRGVTRPEPPARPEAPKREPETRDSAE